MRLPWDGTPIEIQSPVVSPVSEPSTEAPIDMQQFFDDIEAEMAPAPQKSTESTPEGEPE